MSVHFDNIHKLILKKCKNFPAIKDQIAKNGVIEIKKPKLDFFSFVCKTIISQQISDKVAEFIWKKICKKVGTEKLCIDNFKDDLFLGDILNYAKVSGRKINYIISIYRDIGNKKLDTRKLFKMNEKKFREEFVTYKGIGIWSCDIILIFFFNNLNIFPKGDLVIRKMMLELEKLEKKKIDFELMFAPFLSIFSLHLWKMSKRVL